MHYKNVINDINIQAFCFSATLDLTYMADKRLFLSKERTYICKTLYSKQNTDIKRFHYAKASSHLLQYRETLCN